jgi:hypothetical protein
VLTQQIQPFVLKVGEIQTYGATQEYIAQRPRCFLHVDGSVYLTVGTTTDSGRTIVPHSAPEWNDLLFLKRARGCVSLLSCPGLFLGLARDINYESPGVYRAHIWRSTDNLHSLEKGTAIIRVSDGPTRRRKMGEWYGLYFWGSIVDMPDGSLLATIEGNFDSDRVPPVGRRSTAEIHSEEAFKLRTAVVRSEDGGLSWDYLSTVARPQDDDDAVGEGFAEPTMVRLDNGQLLCVMRSGNYTPLHSAWSADDGKTWRGPVYTGLERGLDPCLLKLADGRVLLSYGVRYPAGSPGGPGEVNRGQSLVKLAISQDGTGESWEEVTIGQGLGTVYTTIVESEPNLILCIVDGWFLRVMLVPRIPDTL